MSPVLFDRFIHTAVFLLCYYPLRQFTGGYHADTYRKCFFTFILIFVATIFIANNLAHVGIRPLVVLFSVINGISICLLSPVDHINKIL
ncbi:MAG: accessory gene regulator B family protein, partial [Romboutsia sp.]|uniref:accessory gene regulator B family protein n=1 Tax=Romboutsia sp. TaxID=1965302 RepID=UPI003F37D60A